MKIHENSSQKSNKRKLCAFLRNHRSTITLQTQQKVEEDDDEDDARFRYKLEQVAEYECVRGDSGRSYIDHSEKNGGSGRNSVLRVVR